jgi:hypothetical protein
LGAAGVNFAFSELGSALAETRKLLFIAATPVPGLNDVVCYADAWRNKFIDRAFDAPSKIVDTLAAPTRVIRGTTNPLHLIFVRDEIVSPRSGAPFVVIVNPNGRPMPYIVSVGHRKDFKHQERFETLWPSP